MITKTIMILAIATTFIVGLSFTAVYAGVDELICDGCVNSSDIANNDIRRLDLKNNLISSAKINNGAVMSVDIRDGTIEEGDLSPSLLSSLSGSSYVPFGRVLGSNTECDAAGGGSTTTKLHLDSEDGKPFILTGFFVRIGSVNEAADSVLIGDIRVNGISLVIDSRDLTGTSTDTLDFDVLGHPYSTGVNSPHELASNGVGVDHISIEIICDAGAVADMDFIFNTMASGWMESDDNILFTTSTP